MEENKITLAIKCCCDAGKLLGFVDIDPPRYMHDKVTLMTTEGSKIRLPLGTISARTDTERLEYTAIKSMETPIEVLRKIPSFREYTDEKPDMVKDPLGALAYAARAERAMAAEGMMPEAVAERTENMLDVARQLPDIVCALQRRLAQED